jgi:hypothetical protein
MSTATLGGMRLEALRWQRLFGDLDGAFEAALRAEFDAEVADRTRAERIRIGLLDRLRAATGRQVTVSLDGAGSLAATVLQVGAGWALLDAGGIEVLLNAVAIVSIAGLGAAGAEPLPPDSIESRLGLGYVLRGLARDRTRVVATLRDGSTLTGTIDRVGADAVDVAEHRTNESYPAGGAAAWRSVPFTAIALVRTAP